MPILTMLHHLDFLSVIREGFIIIIHQKSFLLQLVWGCMKFSQIAWTNYHTPVHITTKCNMATKTLSTLPKINDAAITTHAVKQQDHSGTQCTII